MSVKILGGQLKGLSLQVSHSGVTRPTSVLLRRRVFDLFQSLEGVNFVDLCAGSGAMGFEAFSRGADKVYLIESDRQVFEILNNNLQLVELKKSMQKNQDVKFSKENKVEIVRQKAEEWIFLFKNIYLSWPLYSQEETILFFDPPYSAKEVYLKVLVFLFQDNWFKGQLWLEASEKHEFIDNNYLDKWLVKPQKIFQQGDGNLFIINFPQSTALVR